MAQVVTAGSNADADVLVCIEAKFTFLTKQMNIWNKLSKIIDGGGFSEQGLPWERLSFSISGTIYEINEEIQKLEKGDLTDVEGFELLEKLIATRHDAEFELYLDDYWTTLVDKTIVTVINCMEFPEDEQLERMMTSVL